MDDLILDFEKIVSKCRRNPNNCTGQINKRFAGFHIFNSLLKQCNQNICPKIKPIEELQYTLIDISLDGYINQNAYYEWKAGYGLDDDDRYFRGLNKINCVLNCTKAPIIEETIFKIDSDRILEDSHSDKSFYSNARKRKAYWAFISKKKQSDHVADYYHADKFIKSLHKISLKDNTTTKDVELAKNILNKNRHISNALDLYRLCLIRKKKLLLDPYTYSEEQDSVYAY